MTLLGAELERVEPGVVQIGLAFRPELSQQHGFFHAGILSTIADSAGGYAGFTLFPAEAGVLTVCTLDVHVDKAGKRTHCATGLQTLMSLVGRAGVRD